MCSVKLNISRNKLLIISYNQRRFYFIRTHILHCIFIVLIACVMRKDIRHEIFDVVAPKQMTKEEIFDINARKFGYEPKKFLSMDGKSRSFS